MQHERTKDDHREFIVHCRLKSSHHAHLDPRRIKRASRSKGASKSRVATNARSRSGLSLCCTARGTLE